MVVAVAAAMLMIPPARAMDVSGTSQEAWRAVQPTPVQVKNVQTLATGGVKLGRGATDFVNDKFGVCRWLDNFSTENDYFVPDGDAAGWTSFVANAPSAVRVDKCCPAQAAAIVSSDGQAITRTLAVGRARLGSAYSTAAFHESFSLLNGDTETVTAAYQCTDTGWTSTTTRSVISAAGAVTEVSTEPGCGISPVCEGRDFVVYDTCTNTVSWVEPNSRACSCSGSSGRADESAENDVDCERGN